ncbi:hypothetical protein BDR04DRAFT_1011015, partial [Suillus decipiens]
YPFSGWKDWELGSWLLHLGLSMGKIDSFLSLSMVSTQYFQSVKSDKVHVKIQDLPLGPHWVSQVIKMMHPMKSLVMLYWCDPLDCISSILIHPSFHD